MNGTYDDVLEGASDLIQWFADRVWWVVGICLFAMLVIFPLLKDAAADMRRRKELSDEQIVECQARNGMVIYHLAGNGTRWFKDCRLPGR